MVKFIFGRFYGMPLQHVARTMVVFIFVWRAMEWLFQKKMQKRFLWKAGNGLLVCGILVAIGGVTLVSRGNTTEVRLIPFHSFLEAQQQPEIYRSMLMNVFLFFPLGLTMPFALPEKWEHNVLITILIAFLLSVAIEFLQYYFQLGRAETDDVICNTLGCVIGTLAYRRKRFQHRNSNNN